MENRKFKVKCIEIPKGISAKTGEKKDMSCFKIGMELTVIDIDKKDGQIYYSFEEDEVYGTSLFGDCYNSVYFKKI